MNIKPGDRFVRLVALKDAGVQSQKRLWLCKCDCGQEKVVRAASLISKNTTSCGCYSREISSRNGKRKTTHGISKEPVFSSWNNMRERCYNPKHDHYNRYGGRGISICASLRSSPLNLKALLGDRPPGNTLDRIDNSLNYCCGKCSECLEHNWPLNVRWATWTQQQRNKNNNRQVCISGIFKTAPEWAEMYGINQSTIYSRLHRGKTGAALLTHP